MAKQKKVASHPGRSQGKKSPTGAQHQDFTVDVNWDAYYGAKDPTVDLYRQQLRFEARVAGRALDLTPYISQAQWSETTDDNVLMANSLPLQIQVTGSLQLMKPALAQYRQLVPPALDGSIDAQHHIDRWGAVGVKIVASYGYGGSYVPLWMCGVDSSGGNGNAEQVDLSSGTWALNIVDPTVRLTNMMTDFKYGKDASHPYGWRCDEIAADVARKFKFPVKQLVKGTSRFTLTGSKYQDIGPITMIAMAYAAEMARTGKVFMIRWGAPNKDYPLGGLTVAPLRRNPTLLTLRDQLTEASLTRDQSANFATVIQAIAKLKQPHGKTIQVGYVASSPAAIKRFGWIVMKEDFGIVSSVAELEILAKRWLALALTPVRGAELYHPGIATVQAGDAVKIDLPEEGYGDVALSIYGTPVMPPFAGRTLDYAGSLKAAENSDPTLFGLSNETILSTGNVQGSPSSYTDPAVAAVLGTALNVPNASIAFVTNVQHTVQAGSYSMDLQTGFVDRLDPKETRALLDLAARQSKSKKK